MTERNAVTDEARTQELITRHADLEHEIAQEEKRPVPDDLKIKALKKQKLRIKDRIAALAGG